MSKELEDSANSKLELSWILKQTAHLRIEIANVSSRIREVQVSEHPVIQAAIGTLRCVVEQIEHLEVWFDLEPLFDRYRSRNADIS